MPTKPTGQPNGRPPDFSKGRKAATFEFEHPEASLSEIGRHAGMSKEGVRQWRKDPRYQQELKMLEADREVHEKGEKLRLALYSAFKRLDRKLAARRPKALTPTERAKLNSDLMEEVLRAPRKGFSVESPIDGKTYTDREKYAEHIRLNHKEGWTWAGPRSKKPG